jgi:hypothetical protein
MNILSWQPNNFLRIVVTHDSVMTAGAFLMYCCGLCYDPLCSYLTMYVSWQPEHYLRIVVTSVMIHHTVI